LTLNAVQSNLKATLNRFKQDEVPFVEIPQYLSAADLFCFASVTETQDLVTMEALVPKHFLLCKERQNKRVISLGDIPPRKKPTGLSKDSSTYHLNIAHFGIGKS
jgi:hypothetical protein